MSINNLSAFTVDVEDGISIAMRDVFGKNIPQTDRVVHNTHKILQLLSDNKVKGTFFVLGKVAEDFPELIQEIAKEHHEIGIHGYHHLQFFRMTPAEAYQELDSAKKLTEDITGIEVKGHRAPAFSINEQTSWALDIIAEVGFKYDSSIMPIKSRRYGWDRFQPRIGMVETSKENSLIEVPISTIKIFNKAIPFSGGSYLRLFPNFFLQWAFQKETKKAPVILYMHPYELDFKRYPDFYFEALQEVSILRNLKMRSNWVGRKKVYGKLENLLQKNSFTTLWEVIESCDYKNSPKTKL